MVFSTLATAVCLIVCHGGPADHFATFIESLPQNGTPIEVYASGPALKKLEERGIEVSFPFSIEALSAEEEKHLAEQIARSCSAASVVITDLGHPFAIQIQKALARLAPHVVRLAYYDNPEPYVPGGYSSVAAEVILSAQAVLFANANLAEAPIFQEPGKEIAFEGREKIGIGYYPTNQAEKIAKQRTISRLSVRKKVFSENALTDKGQKILVYFGGNNEEYFTKAFPAFLSLLKEGMKQPSFANVVIVIQQHPGAKAKNLDGRKIVELKNPRIILSDLTSDEAQVLADGALYYQTSLGPQFVLARIPAIQVGHESFQDILVRNHLIPSVTTVDQFINALDDLAYQRKDVSDELILKGLGIRENWLARLERAFKEHMNSPQN